MEAYSGFAKVYDLFMDNIPYKEWADYVKGLLAEEGVTEGILLDLGCGTGSVTELLAKEGFDMIGIDNSEEMLDIAMEKRYESGLDILYLLQDMYFLLICLILTSVLLFYFRCLLNSLSLLLFLIEGMLLYPEVLSN